MIKRIRHRALQRLFQAGARQGINPEHIDKIENILSVLDHAVKPADVDLPGFRLHQLKGQLAGYWSITVRANWRIVFRFENGYVTDVDYLDYH